ncbi:MAG: glycerol kinase GlpK [Candidatus Acidiferrales bacterium]|jgi:glycerol kinase
MSTPYILAIDQGTTNTKAVLVDASGRPTFRTSAPVRVTCPKPDWVEQDAREVWDSVQQVVDECLRHCSPARPAAIGISNQRETVVAWERATGNPVAPAIVWQCRRSAAICSQLSKDGWGPLLRERTGLAIDPLFSASKIAWLLDNVSGLRKRAEAGEICFGTVDSWLIWNLTGGACHVCDFSNASRTQLLNISTGAWDDELISLFRIPAGALPRLVSSSALIAETAAIGSTPAGIPIASALGDSHAALAGHASFKPGTVKATYGTGSSLMTLVDTPHQRAAGLATTIAWRVGGVTQYAIEGNISMSGAAIQWLGEFLRLPNPVEDVARLAESAGSSDGVYFVPAMIGLGAPYWDSAVRGAVFGLSRTSTTAHLAKAAVEAIAFQVRDVFDAMEREAGCLLPMLHADGGATHNDQLMQFQADMLGRSVMRSICPDLSALGAAWFAGLALGLWRSLEALEKLRFDSQVFVPRMSEIEREQKYSGWKLSVERARRQAPAQPQDEASSGAIEKEHAQH